MYRARVQALAVNTKTGDIPLHVTEKRSAEQKLQKLLNEQSMSSVGIARKSFSKKRAKPC